mmetsp:Transcript_82671/g.149134  ORF Transcript_82671/g.149134 Transcript_82671/m.149134 type:complete len:295 (+) Transcript_82671:168-1052(+)
MTIRRLCKSSGSVFNLSKKVSKEAQKLDPRARFARSTSATCKAGRIPMNLSWPFRTQSTDVSAVHLESSTPDRINDLASNPQLAASSIPKVRARNRKSRNGRQARSPSFALAKETGGCQGLLLQIPFSTACESKASGASQGLVFGLQAAKPRINISSSRKGMMTPSVMKPIRSCSILSSSSWPSSARSCWRLVLLRSATSTGFGLEAARASLSLALNRASLIKLPGSRGLVAKGSALQASILCVPESAATLAAIRSRSLSLEVELLLSLLCRLLFWGCPPLAAKTCGSSCKCLF